MAKETSAAVVKPPHEKPAPAEKASASAKLVAKGVPMQLARELAGEGDDTLDRRAIAAKRIAWQKTLKKVE